MTLDPAIVRRIQRRVGVAEDGVLGPATLREIDETLTLAEQLASGILAPRVQTPGPTTGELPAAAESVMSPDFIRRATALIVEFEGLDQPGRWPGAASGITLGHGYDLGYAEADTFARDWQPHLSSAHIVRLRFAVGKKGTDAKRIASSFADIRVSEAAAGEVFARATLPRWARAASKTFPGLDRLPVGIRAALTSLVFNRGTSLDPQDSRRREMRAIRDLVATLADPALTAGLDRSPIIREIAAQLRAMKRLWQGRGLDGLLRRREAEAKLVEESITPA